MISKIENTVSDLIGQYAIKTIIVITLLIVFSAGVMLGYCLFHSPNVVTPAAVTEKEKPKTEWKSDPGKMDNTALMDCVSSPIDMRYKILSQNAFSMDIRLTAEDKCKTANSIISVSFPDVRANNIVSLSGGMIYRDGLFPVVAPGYSRRIFDNAFAGGSVIIDLQKKRPCGGMIDLKMSF